MKIIVNILLLICMTMPSVCNAGQKIFSQFSVDLPEGWDGDEQTGFISDNPDEYLLTLGKKDDKGDNFIAQVTIYLLPNKPGVDTATAAARLAEAQGEPTEPVAEGDFMIFKGEPRTRAMKGQAITRVRATPEKLLIIVAQDPLNEGSNQIIASLKGETAIAKEMLGKAAHTKANP